MNAWSRLFIFDIKRRAKSSFTIGYNIIFPIVMIFLLGYLLESDFGKKVSSYEYYTLVMIPFCCMMSVITAAYAAKDESYAKTAYRLLVAPVKEQHIFLAKLLSCSITFSICNITVLRAAMLLWRIDTGKNIIGIIILLIAETFCTCAIGLFIGLGMKNFIAVKNFLNLPILIFAIIGGSFYRVGTLDRRVQLLFDLSPLTWINKSIFLSLYDQQYATLWMTSLLLCIVGVLFTLVGIKSFNKEEYLSGDLPSYEK